MDRREQDDAHGTHRPPPERDPVAKIGADFLWLIGVFSAFVTIYLAIGLADARIWPTEVFLDGIPDPRNEVHYDVIAALGELNLAKFASQDKAVRAAARDRLRPDFVRLLDLLGGPRTL